MIYITMTDGAYREWPPEDYTDYMVTSGLFVIINGNQWVGIYNLDMIKEIVVAIEEDKDEI